MKRSTPISSFRLRERHLRRVLGDLEADVMEVLWRRGEASIREVWEELKRRRSITFNSIMTIMNRLVAKGLLRREDGRGRAIVIRGFVGWRTMGGPDNIAAVSLRAST